MSLPIPSTTGAMNSAVAIDPELAAKMEAPLVALAKMSNGDLRKMMFAFFSFLNRRTDFYLVPHDDDLASGNASMGFREGDAEKLLLAAFRQFPLRRIPKGKAGSKSQGATPSGGSSLVSHTRSEANKPSDAGFTTPASETKSGISTQSSLISGKIESEKDVKPKLTEEGLQVPVGNGGSTDMYRWTQNIEECTILIGLDHGVRAKDLDVSIRSNQVSVQTRKVQEKDEKPKIYIQGDLSECIVPDESTWSVESNVLTLILFKKKKALWDCVIQGDPKIDTSLVDNRRHIADYDDATQGQIRRIIDEQSRERQGGIPVSAQTFSGKNKPDLPPGVEYIDSEKMGKVTKG